VIERFEDLDSWKEAWALTQKVYKLTSLNGSFKDFSLKDQLQRAAVSVMGNIAEGFESHRDKEFIKFLEYAKRSSGEVQSHLYVALDQGYITKNQFEEVYNQAQSCKKLCIGMIRYLQRKEEI